MRTDLLIHFDEAAYKKRLAPLKFFIQFFTKARSIFNSFGFGDLENEDLPKLICDPESFVAEKMFESKQDAVKLFTGMGFNSHKIFDLMDKPSGYPELLQVIGKIPYFIDKKSNEDDAGFSIGNTKELLACYTFNDQGEIDLKQTFYDSYQRACETYISSDKAKAYFNYAKELIALHEKHGIPFPQPFSNAKFFEDIIEVKASKLSPNIIFISRTDRNARGIS